MGDSLPAAALGTGRTAVAVAASFRRTCALLDNGSVKCWGANDSRQLGLGDTADRGDAPAEMGDNLPAVALGAGRTAVALGLPNTNSGSSSCALLDAGTVKCWGGNIHGQLGLGDTTLRGSSPAHMGDNLPAVDLGAGRTATAVDLQRSHDRLRAVDSGRAKCWGRDPRRAARAPATPSIGGRPARRDGRRTARRRPRRAEADGRFGHGDHHRARGIGSPARWWPCCAPRTAVGGWGAGRPGRHLRRRGPPEYFAYVTDPRGTPSGFAGSPTTVTVATAGLVDTDAALVPTTGAIVGKVDGGGDGGARPAWGPRLSGTTGTPVASPTDAGGQPPDGLAPRRPLRRVDRPDRGPCGSPRTSPPPRASCLPARRGAGRRPTQPGTSAAPS